jgi:thymidylate synthase
MKSANVVWVRMVRDLIQSGGIVSPRGIKTREILGYQTRVDMTRPVVSIPARGLSYRFLPGEAWWILRGDNRVETIAKYNSRIANFSDDGVYFFGAYGPRIVDQLSYVVDSIIKDPSTRQAVLSIWRPNPRQTKDVPCTCLVQWIVREGKLHCFDTMRSSDAWLGWPYDVFNFSMLSGLVALLVREVSKGALKLSLGDLVLTAGSQHLYEDNLERATNIVFPQVGDFEARYYEPFDPLFQFDESYELIDHLKLLADRSPVVPAAGGFLKEVYEWDAQRQTRPSSK